MSEFFNNFFNNKKLHQLIYIIFIAGAAMLLFARIDTDTSQKNEVASEDVKKEMYYEPNIELRLQRALRTVDGVGDVRVVINYSSTNSKIIAKDRSEETDSNTKRYQENVVFGNNGEPVVLRENAREIQGVLIVAQGGNNPAVRASLISASMALLGVDAHKIEVLKMK